MKLINIGLRQNLLYPCLYIICINIIRILRIVFVKINNDDKYIFFFSLLNIISNIILSSFYLGLGNKKNNYQRNKKIFGIKLIYTKNEIDKSNDYCKILLLMILDGYFDLISSLRRVYYVYFIRTKLYKEQIINYDIRIRSRQILFASFLWYFIFRSKFHRHHKLSLSMIFICLIILYVLETYTQNKYNNLIDNINIQLATGVINICRVYSDIIEKYILEFYYINPFKIIRNRAIIQLLLILIFYCFNEPRKEFSIFCELLPLKLEFYLSIIILLFYFIMSGFTSIYKIFTIKTYSPMTRTLADSILDIFFFIFCSIEEEEVNPYYFWINIICQIIILFFNCVYNEILVLYCCELDKNTHLEIVTRSITIEMIDSTFDINDDQNLSIESFGSID